jgi:23S rRNA pseudouridine2605 synthase
MIKNNKGNSRDDKSNSGREGGSRRRTTGTGQEKPAGRYSDKDEPRKSGFGSNESGNTGYKSRDKDSNSRDDRKSGFNRSESGSTGYKPRKDFGGAADSHKSGFDKNERSGSGYQGRDENRKPGYNRTEGGNTGYKPRDKDAGGFKKPWDKKDQKPRPFKAASSKDGITESKRGYFKKEDQSPEDYKAYQDKKRSERSFDSRPFRNREDGNFKPRYEERGERGNKTLGKPKVGSAKTDDLVRLNRYIANSGICSRRKADELIAAGVISVNHVPITELGHKVDPYKDEVRYNGELLKREKKIYVLLNKPKDYITTTDDPQERRTVMQLVEKASRERIYPVGRLDRNTTGLLLMTNDGELADRLSHPKNGITKIYHVELSKNLSQGDFNKIEFGLELEDGLIKPDNISYVAGASKKEIGIQIHSGKNRIVRRIFEHLGYEVVKLDRVVYGNLTKKDLPRGRWRYLDEHELVQIKHLIK